jgi:DNA-binding TFAR19-related protein (PDSD5 family)
MQVFPMSDPELEAIRRSKLRKLQQRLATKEQTPPEELSEDAVLDRVFRGRAWEVFHTASSQYPQLMLKLKSVLAKLASTGRLQELSGEQLYVFLRNLGLRVRLNTKIRFTDHGQLKSLSEKIKEDLNQP